MAINSWKFNKSVNNVIYILLLSDLFQNNQIFQDINNLMQYIIALQWSNFEHAVKNQEV